VKPTPLSHGRGWLDAPAAASLHRIDAALGRPLQITSAGRTYQQQQALYEAYLAGHGAFAAKPGTSPHEAGNAIDTDERHITLMQEHGWHRPLSFEPWHFLYRASDDRHRNDPAPATTPKPEQTTEPQEETMKGYSYKYGNKIVHVLFNEVSGFYVRHGGVPAAYNNAIARNWNTGSWPELTKSHDALIKAQCDQIRAGRA